MKKIFIIYVIAIICVTIVFMMPSQSAKNSHEWSKSLYEKELRNKGELSESQIQNELNKYDKENPPRGETFVTALKSAFFIVTVVLIILVSPILYIKQTFL